MYLTAQEITYKPTTLLKEWKGRAGKFVKTFGIDDTRNENLWRASWEGIKRNIQSAINRPGIAYEKCNEDGCGLEHVEAETFESNLEKQKPYERTKIIDYVLDEDNHSADVIHEVFDDDFWTKLENGDVRYVSPMIWPTNGGAEVLGYDEDRQLPIIDSDDWNWVHTAFLEEKPAFGTDKANVKLMCEGTNCDVKLLTAKSLEADANSENLSHLQQIPLLIKHKGKLVLASATSCVQKIIKEKTDAGIEIDDQALAIAYSECGESKPQNAKSSFKTCACSSKQVMNDPSAEEQSLVDMQAKLKAAEDEKKDLEAKLKAQEDEKSQHQQARKARYAKLFAQTDEEDAEKMVASLKSQEDEEEYKAAKAACEEMKEAKKAQSEDPEKKEMQASLKSMQAKLSEPMVNGLVAIRRGKMPEAELLNYEKSLKAKSFSEIESDYQNESYLINVLNSQPTGSEFSGLPFPGETGPLIAKSKSIDEILEEN